MFWRRAPELRALGSSRSEHSSTEKLDLAQAEAVQELIGAKNELALSVAEQQLQGALSNKISSFQRELVDIAAILEAWIDLPRPNANSGVPIS